jgi:hypothetical protein
MSVDSFGGGGGGAAEPNTIAAGESQSSLDSRWSRVGSEGGYRVCQAQSTRGRLLAGATSIGSANAKDVGDGCGMMRALE